jgi:hypothetical protein
MASRIMLEESAKRRVSVSNEFFFFFKKKKKNKNKNKNKNTKHKTATKIQAKTVLKSVNEETMDTPPLDVLGGLSGEFVLLRFFFVVLTLFVKRSGGRAQSLKS